MQRRQQILRHSQSVILKLQHTALTQSQLGSLILSDAATTSGRPDPAASWGSGIRPACPACATRGTPSGRASSGHPRQWVRLLVYYFTSLVFILPGYSLRLVARDMCVTGQLNNGLVFCDIDHLT